MTRIRVAFFLFSLVLISTITIFVSLYARGYRFDTEKGGFHLAAKGLLVANSQPNGAQVFINGQLKTATNSTINLSPKAYDLLIKKEGYLPWSKRVVIEKEVVTQIDVVLFPAAPSVSALTFSGAFNAVPSQNYTKIAYGVPVNTENNSAGLWVMYTSNLPIGFAKESQQITDGDLIDATWEWSPDSREILLTTKLGSFLLDASTFTPQNTRTNVGSQVAKIKADWQEIREKRLSDKLAKLPDEIEDIFKRKTTDIEFSPDENKILYTASASATIPENLIKPMPGASTQRQERTIKLDKKYVFDIKEDRNFVITDQNQPAYWLPTSNHLVLPQSQEIIIIDYDGTNAQSVYSGSFITPFAYPYPDSSKLLILTNLGSNGTPANLYSLNLK